MGTAILGFLEPEAREFVFCDKSALKCLGVLCRGRGTSSAITVISSASRRPPFVIIEIYIIPLDLQFIFSVAFNAKISFNSFEDYVSCFTWSVRDTALCKKVRASSELREI